MSSGTLFDIQSHSVHDGPGCRTTLFFSGCPLRCGWCANPESWRMAPQILFSEHKCHAATGCRLCLKYCNKEALNISEEGQLSLDKQICINCDDMSCSQICYHNALRVCGKVYQTEEVMSILKRDQQFWRGNGGVTFSGGEPFMQNDFMFDLLRACKNSHIHTAIETTAYAETQLFLKTMALLDFAFIDVKHMDPQKHLEGTGVDNTLILANIRALKETAWPGRLVLRMPVIEGYNDTDSNIQATIDFMNELNLFEINLLPFHRLGDSKWQQLGQTYAYAAQEATSKGHLSTLQHRFLDAGIACYSGHETCF